MEYRTMWSAVGSEARFSLVEHGRISQGGSTQSEAGKKAEQGVLGLEPPNGRLGRCQLAKRGFLGDQICFNVGVVVSRLSCPSESPMTEQSTPACSKCIAVV
jgi:hypothetical protein